MSKWRLVGVLLVIVALVVPVYLYVSYTDDVKNAAIWPEGVDANNAVGWFGIKIGIMRQELSDMVSVYYYEDGHNSLTFSNDMSAIVPSFTDWLLSTLDMSDTNVYNLKVTITLHDVDGSWTVTRVTQEFAWESHGTLNGYPNFLAYANFDPIVVDKTGSYTLSFSFQEYRTDGWVTRAAGTMYLTAT